MTLITGLNRDRDLKGISDDVMHLIKCYINELVIEESEQPIYYKYIRSNIYDKSDMNESKVIECEEYFAKQDGRDHKLTIVVLGSGAVGKTCLTERVISDNWY